MIKQYLLSSWHLMRENKLLSLISVIGTAMAVALIMVIIILSDVKMGNHPPEVNRDRMLYVKWGSTVHKEKPHLRNYNRLSLYDLKQVFYPLTTAEAVSAFVSYGYVLASTPGNDEEESRFLIYTDLLFWKINEFVFLAGKPYGQASFESGLKQAVIGESLARSLFGGATEAIGRRLDVNFVEHTVCGVVKDVSPFATMSYSEIWIPYTANKELTESYEGMDWHSGSFICTILAHSPADFSGIREEVRSNLEKMNAESPTFRLDIMDQPYDLLSQLLNTSNGGGALVAREVMRYVGIILILLLVPGINLSGLTQSRMRRRLGELGVRKAFGATRKEIVLQVLTENLFSTLSGGLLGLGASYGILWVMDEWLLHTQLPGVAALEPSMISLKIFAAALVFCLLLNLLSAVVPAWRVSGKNIVNALNEK